MQSVPVTKLSKDITVGPQLSPAEWEKLSHDGFRTVVNLSRKGELDQMKPEEEAVVIEQHGMNYLHFPLSVGGMTKKEVDDFLVETGKLEGPIYIHCRLGQRSGPLALILHAVRKGLSKKRMRKRAHDLGLMWHSPYLNGFAEAYLSQREAAAA